MHRGQTAGIQKSFSDHWIHHTKKLPHQKQHFSSWLLLRTEDLTLAIFSITGVFKTADWDKKKYYGV